MAGLGRCWAHAGHSHCGKFIYPQSLSRQEGWVSVRISGKELLTQKEEKATELEVMQLMKLKVQRRNMKQSPHNKIDEAFWYGDCNC